MTTYTLPLHTHLPIPSWDTLMEEMAAFAPLHLAKEGEVVGFNAAAICTRTIFKLTHVWILVRQDEALVSHTLFEVYETLTQEQIKAYQTLQNTRTFLQLPEEPWAQNWESQEEREVLFLRDSLVFLDTENDQATLDLFLKKTALFFPNSPASGHDRMQHQMHRETLRQHLQREAEENIFDTDDAKWAELI